jgi:hypothetical protein
MIRMEYGKMLSGSIDFAIEAVWKRWVRWILLVVSAIIFPLILGYVMEIYRGQDPAPELRHWGRLFIDGLKLIAAWIIYMLPVIAVIAITGGLAIIAAMGTAGSAAGLDEIFRYPDLFLPILAGFLTGLFISVLLAIFISLVATIGVIRMARTGRLGEAFNFSAILSTIRKIGWGRYVLALIILSLIMLVFSAILLLIVAIPYVGWIIYLFLLPPLTIFEARYLTQVYEKGEEPGVTEEQQREEEGGSEGGPVKEAEVPKEEQEEKGEFAKEYLEQESEGLKEREGEEAKGSGEGQGEQA